MPGSQAVASGFYEKQALQDLTLELSNNELAAIYKKFCRADKERSGQIDVDSFYQMLGEKQSCVISCGDRCVNQFRDARPPHAEGSRALRRKAAAPHFVRPRLPVATLTGAFACVCARAHVRSQAIRRCCV